MKLDLDKMRELAGLPEKKQPTVHLTEAAGGKRMRQLAGIAEQVEVVVAEPIIELDELNVSTKYRGQPLSKLQTALNEAIAAKGDIVRWDSFFGFDSKIKTAREAIDRLARVRTK